MGPGVRSGVGGGWSGVGGGVSGAGTRDGVGGGGGKWARDRGLSKSGPGGGVVRCRETESSGRTRCAGTQGKDRTGRQ